jgi:hypothetical protein
LESGRTDRVFLPELHLAPLLIALIRPPPPTRIRTSVQVQEEEEEEEEEEEQDDRNQSKKKAREALTSRASPEQKLLKD